LGDELSTGDNGKGACAVSRETAIGAGLGELLKAYEYALDAGRTMWDLAVEISLLRELGLTPSDLRWLICKGYLAHARDVTRPEDGRRAFRGSANLVFTKRSCFVLTNKGASYARSMMPLNSSVFTLLEHNIESTGTNGNGGLKAITHSVKPHWDSQRHELWVANQLVKQFKGQALNQERILAVFEEEDWAARIDDPLPLTEEIDPKRRLHDTIKCLNRKQRHQLIHFRGDGSGEGIIWELAGQRD